MFLPLSLAGLALSLWAPGGLTLAVPSWLLSTPLWGGVLLLLLLRCLYHPSVPAVHVALEPSEACDVAPPSAPPSAKELADPVRKQSSWRNITSALRGHGTHQTSRLCLRPTAPTRP